ncbi:MAG: hypothetical protein JO295_11765 [Verrucomicrobia bacterium]|nr:hypothetical protein [Verrucomicrobiota bacterium]
MQTQAHTSTAGRSSSCLTKVRQAGSALVISLLTLTVLAFIFGTTMLVALNQHHVVYQIASWQEALHGAESGADIGLAALNSGSWTGWKTLTGTPPSAIPATGSASSTVPPAGSYNYFTTTFYHGGDGNTRMTVYTTIDAPASLISGGQQWYRVRSTGITDVPGPLYVSMEPLDSTLRRLSFVTDRQTGAALSHPQATRTVEVVAQPATSGYPGPIETRNSFQMSGGGVVDSFNSSDPTKSTNGLYDINKRQSHGDVYVMNSANSDLRNTYIYGNLNYGSTAVKNTTNVQGTVQAITPTTLPSPSNPGPGWSVTDSSVTIINGTKTLTGGTKAAPARYKVSSVNVPGGTSLTIQPNAAGQQSYIEIWVTGDLTTSGSGYITQQSGVHVTYYIDGNVTVSGQSFQNQNNQASTCTIYCVPPASGTNKVTVSGSGTFIGVINAPGSDFTISGSANFSGALIGNTMNISGGASVHFDEALKSSSPGGTAFSVASWYEDLNK